MKWLQYCKYVVMQEFCVTISVDVNISLNLVCNSNFTNERKFLGRVILPFFLRHPVLVSSFFIRSPFPTLMQSLRLSDHLLIRLFRSIFLLF